MQVEPGEWQVQLTGRALGAPTSFRATPETENWPKEEIWGFNADRALRVVNVEGATPIDLSQTNAPFKDLPAYVVTADNDLKLVEQFRGDPSPSPNDFSLARSMWLSFDGSSYTVRDTLNGKLALPTRLAASFVPGRMTVDDKPELITRLGDAKPGVELPSGTHTIVAVSEIPRRGLDTAVGWETDVAALTGELHLPPGWRLLWTHGVDRAPTAWLPSWTLWDIFLVVISVVLALRLLGPTAAAMVALTLVLVYQESEAPTLVWIVLLLLLAVLRIGRGRFGQFARLSYFVVFAFTVIAVLSFAIDNFRMAIYPQLENAGYIDLQAGGACVGAQRAAPFHSRCCGNPPTWLEELVVTAKGRESKPRRQFEANTQVQTGPGVPTWRWRSETLIWDGPVTAAQPIDLVLSPPWLTRSFHVIGPVLLLLLVAMFGGATPAAVNAAAGLAEAHDRAGRGRAVRRWPRFVPPDARADIPSPDMLGELEKRLTEPPDCLPACAAVEHATVKLNGDALTVQLDINAARTVAVPLPATDGAMVAARRPRRRSARGGFARRGGTIVDRAERGCAQHRTVRPRNPCRPVRIAVSYAAGRRLARSERLARLRRTERSPARCRAPVRTGSTHARRSIRRESRAGTDRAVFPSQPHVRFRHSSGASTPRSNESRRKPAASPLQFRWCRESRCSTVACASKTGAIIGVVAPEEQQMAWDSALATADTLQLTGPPLPQWTEQWTLVPSNFWHVDYDGFAPMKLESDASAGPRFQPLAGETLQVRLTRPVPVAGRNHHGRARRRHRITRRSRAPHHARARVAEQPGRQLPGAPAGRRASSSASRSTVSRNRSPHRPHRCRCR